MKRSILVAAALGLMLSLLLPGAPGTGQEPQFEEAPKRVTVARSLAVFDGHGRGFVPPPMDLSHLTGQRMPSERVSAPKVSSPLVGQTSLLRNQSKLSLNCR